MKNPGLIVAFLLAALSNGQNIPATITESRDGSVHRSETIQLRERLTK
jgi:hypothetical protein